MSTKPAHLDLRIRLKRGESVVLGPGKAQMLESIAETGSIAAAGRAMSMSYKRAWMLIEAMNAEFGAPLVEKTRGGSAGGGAQLTERGAQILELYIKLVTAAAEATIAERAALEALLQHRRES